MICRYCNKEVADGSIFCSFCGERLARKKKGKKEEIKVPKARQLKSGAWNIELRKEGESVTAATKSLCEAKALAIRAGFLEKKKTAPLMTVGELVDNYINSKSNIISQSTLRGYQSYRKTHIKEIEDKDVSTIQWQNWINVKAEKLSPKTIANLWRLITASMAAARFTVPAISLPAIPAPDENFLDYMQIQTFIEAVKGKDVELAALLALHSLRRSEIMALTPASFDLDKRIIRVRGARVQGPDNRLIYKRTNKSDTSTRDVPIMIPRLTDLIPDSGEGFIFDCHPNRLTEKLHTVCKHAGLPLCGLHDLRRSMASLAYHLGWDERTLMRVGGWSDIGTVHKFYVKLAQSDINEHTQSMSDFYHFTNEFTNES